ncbi:MAG: hypothetical protein RSC93_02290 [Erysipelotrichaceae bacterium]
MIEVGQTVKVISYNYTSYHCGRKSQYDIGDEFVVKEISYDEIKGYIISDDDYNFLHINDLKVI